MYLAHHKLESILIISAIIIIIMFALRDCQTCWIGRPYRDAQDRLLWRDKTCPAHT